ncbi:MAG: methyltransferase [Chloroflexota bacterium]|nr:methyltransferase [Chloroflexota bacterium]
MRLGTTAQNILDRIVLATGLVPTPIVDTHVAMMLARTVMVGTKLGVFEALADGPLAASEVAARCNTHPTATEKLLNALAGAGYLRDDGERYALAPVARKWLLQGSKDSVYDKMLFQFAEWEWIERYDDFVRSGEPVRFHGEMTADQWGYYQRGMAALARFIAPEVAWRTPVPKGARDMLDIGGSHGLFSIALCRRHPGLRAVILDLPDAVAHAVPLVAHEGMGDRVTHWAGDLLTEDLGEEKWDLIFMANVAHHLDEATNKALTWRVARALRPGGAYVIQEVIRPTSAKEAGQLGALLDLYYALTSEVGTWTYEEMAGWQREAGLAPRKPIRFRLGPGSGQQVAVKPP